MRHLKAFRKTRWAPAKNEELEKKANLSDTDSLQIAIEQQMEQSKENSEKNKKRKPPSLSKKP